MPNSPDPVETRPSAKSMVKRLKTFVGVFTSMDSENERRANLYYLVAYFYGNDVGDRALQLLPRKEE